MTGTSRCLHISAERLGNPQNWRHPVLQIATHLTWSHSGSTHTTLCCYLLAIKYDEQPHWTIKKQRTEGGQPELNQTTSGHYLPGEVLTGRMSHSSNKIFCYAHVLEDCSLVGRETLEG